SKSKTLTLFTLHRPQNINNFNNVRPAQILNFQQFNLQQFNPKPSTIKQINPRWGSYAWKFSC
ncbi:MAG: hypothetical protein ACK5L5_05950, partial [Bacteroidales bacterium]